MAQAWISSKAERQSWRTPPAKIAVNQPHRSGRRDNTGQHSGWRWMNLASLPWLLGGSMGLAQPVWAARGTSFRGEWSLGNLIGALIILGILVGLAAFLIWPRRRS
jgi:hypothetical protein